MKGAIQQADIVCFLVKHKEFKNVVVKATQVAILF